MGAHVRIPSALSPRTFTARWDQRQDLGRLPELATSSSLSCLSLPPSHLDRDNPQLTTSSMEMDEPPRRRCRSDADGGPR
jgi:hypothetical protein